MEGGERAKEGDREEEKGRGPREGGGEGPVQLRRFRGREGGEIPTRSMAPLI